MAEIKDAVPEVAVPEPEGKLEQGLNKVKETFTGATDSVKEGLAKGTEMVSEASGKFGVLLLVGIVVAAVLLFGAYVLYQYLSTRLTNKLAVMVPDSKIPRKGTELTKLDGAGLPPATNGNRATFMFWIYIHDINKFSGTELRHVLHRGEESLIGASPSVYLDGKLNRMYIRFDTTKETPTSFISNISAINNDVKTNPNSVWKNRITPDNQLDAIKADLSTRGIIIDYIPLQRWVHVSVVVNETVNKGYMSAYLDGELVKTVSSGDKIGLSNGTNMIASFQNLNLNKKGDVYVGGNLYNDNVSKGFSGIVSNIVFANFDMNGREVRDQYIQGPIKNLTSKLGLPAYGLRSPVYRVG